jgi:hypothetical protein
MVMSQHFPRSLGKPGFVQAQRPAAEHFVAKQQQAEDRQQYKVAPLQTPLR